MGLEHLVTPDKASEGLRRSCEGACSLFAFGMAEGLKKGCPNDYGHCCGLGRAVLWNDGRQGFQPADQVIRQHQGPTAAFDGTKLPAADRLVQSCSPDTGRRTSLRNSEDYRLVHGVMRRY
jgi:hypothetical protein